MKIISLNDVNDLIELMGGQETALKYLEDLRTQKFRLESVLSRTTLVQAEELDKYDAIGNVSEYLQKWPHLVPQAWWGKHVLFLGDHEFNERDGKYFHCQVIDDRGRISWSQIWKYQTAADAVEAAKKDPEVIIPVVEKRRQY